MWSKWEIVKITMDSHMEHSLCLSYSHIHISFFVCSRVWATSYVEPDTICVSDDGPKTHMT